RVAYSGFRYTAPSGGTRMSAQAGLFKYVIAAASIGPELTTPDPPYCSSSVLSTSRQAPPNGSASRYPSYGAPAKFTTHTSASPQRPHRTKESTLRSASAPSSHSSTAGELSCEYSAGDSAYTVFTADTNRWTPACFGSSVSHQSSPCSSDHSASCANSVPMKMSCFPG